MSSYDFGKYREPMLTKELRQAAAGCRLDRIECAIVSVMGISAEELKKLSGEGRDNPPGLKLRRLYDEKPEEEISEEWRITARKAKLNGREVELAKEMKLTCKRVQGMISREKWKDIPALHIRRMYDERHIHPALIKYWEEREGAKASPYTKAYRNTRKRA